MELHEVVYTRCKKTGATVRQENATDEWKRDHPGPYEEVVSTSAKPRAKLDLKKARAEGDKMADKAAEDLASVDPVYPKKRLSDHPYAGMGAKVVTEDELLEDDDD